MRVEVALADTRKAPILANLMELLFIVLMVNVVANAREPKEDVPKQPSEGAVDEKKT